MVVEEGTNNPRMLSVCKEIEELLNQLAAEFVKDLQYDLRAVSEGIVLAALVASPKVFCVL